VSVVFVLVPVVFVLVPVVFGSVVLNKIAPFTLKPQANSLSRVHPALSIQALTASVLIVRKTHSKCDGHPCQAPTNRNNLNPPSNNTFQVLCVPSECK